MVHKNFESFPEAFIKTLFPFKLNRYKALSKHERRVLVATAPIDINDSY
jgi:hypothetical protein